MRIRILRHKLFYIYIFNVQPIFSTNCTVQKALEAELYILVSFWNPDPTILKFWIWIQNNGRPEH